MSEKNQAFHRLATKRVETIAEALRIFSNLSGPSYEWSPDEVLAYFNQINRARDEAIERFRDTKRWRDSPSHIVDKQEASPELAEVAEVEPAEEAVETPAEEAPAQKNRQEKRQGLIAEIMASGDTVETMAETVAMQREVIERLQQVIDGLRAEKAA